MNFKKYLSSNLAEATIVEGTVNIFEYLIAEQIVHEEKFQYIIKDNENRIVAIGNKAKIKNNELVIKPTIRNNLRNIDCILFFVSKVDEIRIIDQDDNFKIRILSIAQFCKFLKVKNPLFKSADELKAESYLEKIAKLEEVTKNMNKENLLLKEKIYQQENSITQLDSLIV